jgi:diadenylate cyclase
VSGALSALEVEDLVTVRDVVTVLQRAEMVRRIAEEVDGYIVELGVDGRLILLQLEELMGGVEDDRRYVIRDYAKAMRTAKIDELITRLSELSTERLLDLKEVAALLGLVGEDGELDSGIQPRGFRLLSRIPRLPDVVITNIVERFGSLNKLMRATTDDLNDVEGVGDTRARAIKEGLSRLAESSILDRYS